MVKEFDSLYEFCQKNTTNYTVKIKLVYYKKAHNQKRMVHVPLSHIKQKTISLIFFCPWTFTCVVASQ